MYLGKNIKYLREVKFRLKGGDLGKEIGKTASDVSNYEIGKVKPPLEVLIRLSKFFEVDLDSFIFKDLEFESKKTGEPEPSYHKINVLDELCELRKQVEELQKDIIEIKKNLNLTQ